MKSFRISNLITDRRDESLKLYFRDISKYKLLTPDEELELAKRVKDGDEVAKNKLIEANLRFVVSVAKQYQGRGIPLVDLIQDGTYGLIQAAQLFDPDRGFKFISYAVWWIRQSIVKALSDQSRTIRLPVNQIINISKLNKVTEDYEKRNELKPSYEELSENTSIDYDKINNILSYNSKTVSLDCPFNDNEVDCLLDVLPNENSVSSDYLLDEEDISYEIEQVLSKLPYRDRDVLRMFYGIKVSPLPQSEIAKKFGISSERVRQIIHKALDTIRNKYKDELKELL